MVTFNDNSFVIEIQTGSDPVYSWQNLHSGLCDLLASVNNENVGEDHYAVVGLLAAMMPDGDIARKMIDK